jgi:TPR repeat protein
MANNRQVSTIDTKSNKKKALPASVVLLTKLATGRDHTESQYKLGKIYFEGETVTYDYETSKDWLEKASNKGHLEAQHTLGLLHLKNGDNDEARSALQKAINNGYAKAQYDLGILNLKEGKGEVAKEIFKKLAVDDTNAQCELGKMYFYGTAGVEQNYREAFELLGKAHSKGNHEATLIIAIANLEGKGVEKSKRLAKEWFTKAANLGSAESQYRLGQLIYTENKNSAVAKGWLEKAANNNHVQSQYLLGQIFLEEKQPKLASDWLIKAADAGHADAQYTLAHMYLEGNGVDKNIDKANELILDAANSNHINAEYLHRKNLLKHCKSKGATWSNKLTFGFLDSTNPAAECVQALIPLLSTLADKNHSDTQFMLGTLYLEGLWIKQNYTTATMLFTKAAANDHADAQYELGNINFYGNGTAVNYGLSKGYFEKAAAKDHTGAQYMFGKLLYGNYNGVKQDFNLAREQFIKAAANDKVEAKHSLGMMNFEGNGFKQNYTAAMEWFTEAAEAQYVDALYMQGMLYFDGKGVPQNYDMARECFEKAGKEHADALSMLISHSDLLNYNLDDLEL